MTVCPSGWHLPSDADWNVLMKFVNPSCSDNSNNSSCADAGTKLKATSGWQNCSYCKTGTDNYGFSALPGGFGNWDGSFANGGSYGYWWSASYDDNNAYFRYMGYNKEDVIYSGISGKVSSQSIRCVKDVP